MDATTAVILMAVLLGLSALFSSSEMAFFNLQQVRVHHLVASGVPNAQRVARLKEKPEKFLATILLGNNLVNTALSALAMALAISLLGTERQGLSIALTTAVVTVGIVVLGETAPKILAARHSERLVFLLVRLWEAVELVLFPLATTLYGMSRLLTRPFQRSGGLSPLMSREELRTMVRLGVEEGTVEKTQAEIFHKAFRLGDLRANEIMTPRTAIVWVRKDATLAEFFQTYAKKNHTRFPIYEGEVDKVLGVLYVKDALKAFVEGKLREQDPIASLVRPAYFYPETKPLDDLFVEMRANGTQMVMLVDEHGGIAGLLTMKEIIGEVVGPLVEEEEKQEPEPEVKTIDARTVQVDADMRIEEVNERLGLGLPEGDYETLAGFVLSALGHIPREGEQVRRHGLRLVVAQMKGVKIERVLVRRR